MRESRRQRRTRPPYHHQNAFPSGLTRGFVERREAPSSPKGSRSGNLFRTRHDVGRQSRTMIVDLARPCEPDLVPLRMIDDVLQRTAQRPQAIGLPDNHGVKRDTADERLLLAQVQHLLKLLDDHFLELDRGMPTHKYLG
jgi:hypothetical protein